MANRRMFSRDVVCTDEFLDMPSSARALYFQLGMDADDDGFVGNPRTICRMCGCSQDDMKVLIAKDFVKLFDSGVIVITHWRLMNKIQPTRYKPTIYQTELKMIGGCTVSVDKLSTTCQQPVDKLPTNCQQSVDNLSASSRQTVDKPSTQYSVVEYSPVEYSPVQDSVVEVNDTITAYAVNNLTHLSPTHMQELLSFTDDLPDDVIRFAIDKACSLNKRNWAYVRTILNAYVENGVKTVGDAKAEDDRHRQAGTKKTVTQGAHDYSERKQDNGYFDDDFFTDLSAYRNDPRTIAELNIAKGRG